MRSRDVSAPLVKTATPGIFKRGSRYAIVYRVNGRQRWESARTLADARKLKDARRADIARGEFFEASRLTFREYAQEWVERYQGRGRGFRESTRDEYRRSLENYVLPYFDQRSLRLAELAPRDVANFIAWLCDETVQSKRLSDSTVRNILNPIRACLSTAVAEGLVRHNPTRGVSLPHRPSIEGDEGEQARAFTRAQLADVLRVVHPEHRTVFELLAYTGLRISEALALQWRHVQLDGSGPHVKVRRALVRGRMHPPKSRHGRRDVPIPYELVTALRQRRADSAWPGDDELVFPSRAGTPILVRNFRRRVLDMALAEADVAWAGFHTFRHTCASMLFERGANAVQVQRWLGHHSAAFTLSTYVHLLDDGVGEALTAADIAPRGANKVLTQHPEAHVEGTWPDRPEPALEVGIS